MKELTIKEAQLIAKDIKEWASSEKGQREIKKSINDLRLKNRKFRESLKVDWKTMHEPMTI